MNIEEIISWLETWAPPSLQENYDNAGLLTGDKSWECSGIICALDVTEDVILEAMEKRCNLVVAHHPLIFSGLKKINGKNYVEKTVIRAIKNDIAVYAIHTNLDNVLAGVNGKMAERLGLKNTRVLLPKTGILKKLFFFVPVHKAEEVRSAVFQAGGGEIGQYDSCSFNSEGMGTFKGNEQTQPYVGTPGILHNEAETKVEIVFPAYLEQKLVSALKSAHPYEEVAYDIIALDNAMPSVGAGLVGDLTDPMEETAFLKRVKEVFNLPVIRHTSWIKEPIRRVALCGGAGSFLISSALKAGAQVFITGDIRYHQFFDGEGKMMIADIGHFESEQFTINLLHEKLAQKFPTFAVLKTEVRTNPVHYYF